MGRLAEQATLSSRILFGAVKHTLCCTDECCFGEKEKAKVIEWNNDIDSLGVSVDCHSS